MTLDKLRPCQLTNLSLRASFIFEQDPQDTSTHNKLEVLLPPWPPGSNHFFEAMNHSISLGGDNPYPRLDMQV